MSRKIKALSDHRTEADAEASLEKLRLKLVREGKGAEYFLKVEPTKDPWIPWAVYLYMR